MRLTPETFGTLRVKLIAPDHPLAREVQQLKNRYAGRAPIPIRYGETILGGESIDEAYFYPSVNATTNS